MGSKGNKSEKTTYIIPQNSKPGDDRLAFY
jgi:hypothetical protein